MAPHPETIVELPVAVVERGFFQPREYFDPQAMEATRRSIQEKGQLYPVIVRPIWIGNPLFDPQWSEPHYELADGERRFRCCKELGYTHIKALVRELTDEQMLDHTLTTNDSLPLNPIERATVFSRLAKEFRRSQAEIAKSFNLKQQQVSEYLRLLELPPDLQDLTARAVISLRHAREILKLESPEDQKSLAQWILDGNIGTRELAAEVQRRLRQGKIQNGTVEELPASPEAPGKQLPQGGGEIEGGQALPDVNRQNGEAIFPKNLSKNDKREIKSAGKLKIGWFDSKFFGRFESNANKIPWKRLFLSSLCGFGMVLLGSFLPERVLLSVFGVLVGLLAYLFMVTE